MPWLHLIFEAWEDYHKQREQEAAERAALEAQSLEAMRVFEDEEIGDDHGNDLGDEDKDKKKKKKKKHKDKHKDKD